MGTKERVLGPSKIPFIYSSLNKFMPTPAGGTEEPGEIYLKDMQ